MLKEGPSLPSIGLHYGMQHLECLVHTFGLAHTHLAQLMSSVIMGGPSIMFKRHADATAIWRADYGAKGLPCNLVWHRQPVLMGHGIGHAHRFSCHVRSEPVYALDPEAFQDSGVYAVPPTCRKWVRGMVGPVTHARGWLSPGHSHVLPVSRLGPPCWSTSLTNTPYGLTLGVGT